jgi:hypothetical protein
MLFFTKNKNLKKYKSYREVGKVLNDKIIERYMSREIVLLSGKYLGIVRKDNLIFDNESESVALMDFVINECRINGKTAIELYKEKVKVDNDIETDILDGLISSYTSLFKITNVNRSEKKLILADVLKNNDNTIEIIDIGFSQTAAIGLLFFTRLVPLADFNITGGFGFPFNGGSEETLLKEYKQIAKRVKSSDESIKRYVAFFKLYKKHGMETGFL